MSVFIAVLFNMLIALMADTFVSVKEKEEVEFLRSRADIICGQEETMTAKMLNSAKVFPRFLHTLELLEDSEFTAALRSIQGQGNEVSTAIENTACSNASADGGVPLTVVHACCRHRLASTFTRSRTTWTTTSAISSRSSASKCATCLLRYVPSRSSSSTATTQARVSDHRRGSLPSAEGRATRPPTLGCQRSPGKSTDPAAGGGQQHPPVPCTIQAASSLRPSLSSGLTLPPGS